MDYQAVINKYLGQPVEAEDPSNKDQCMDWAFKFCDEIGVPREAIRHLHAYEVFTKPNDLTLKYFDYIPNTPNGIPTPGSLLVFSTGVGVSGHISVAVSGDTNQVKSADQNWNGHQYVEYINHPYDNILGWLTPKQPSSANQAQNLAQPFTDQTLIPIGGDYGNPELQAVKGMLKDLTTIKKDKSSLEQQVSDLNSTNKQQADMIKDLQDRNGIYAGQIGQLQKKIDNFTQTANPGSTVVVTPAPTNPYSNIKFAIILNGQIYGLR